jgi:large subunit ribosomal protein L10
MVDKAKKIQSVAEIKEAFESATTVVVARFSGLTIKESDDLRKKARALNAKVRVTKNTLAGVAAEGTKFSNIVDLFSGQTIIAYSNDAVSSAKLLADFAKGNEKVSIAGGSYDGQLLDEASVKKLAATPTLDQSRARLAGLLIAPAGQLARLINSPAGKVARVISAYSKKEA